MRMCTFQRGFTAFTWRSPHFAQDVHACIPPVTLVPLSQGSGLQAVPVVHSGERVREGQLIGRGTNENPVHVHAPIPGMLREYRTVSLPDGTLGQAAVIELSGSFDILGRPEHTIPWKHTPESELIRLLEEKGVVNTFQTCGPLGAQVRELKRVPRRTVALRMYDADPTINTGSWLMVHHRREVLEGFAILAKAIDSPQVVFFTTEKKAAVISEAEKKELFGDRTIRSIRMPLQYPNGSERQLLPRLDHRDRVLIVDPMTAVAVFETVVRNRPLITRYITVTGTALKHPQVLKARIGTPVGDLIEECGGFSSEPSRIVVNGLMTGTAIYDLDTPVTKYTESIHIVDRDVCPAYEVTNCIHCGLCLEVCPSRLDPMQLALKIKKRRLDSATISEAGLCEQCGACSVNCPSRIPLAHIIGEVLS